MEREACSKFADYRDVILDIAVDDTSFVNPARVDEVRRHVAACSYCRAELEACQSILSALRPPPVADEVVAEVASRVPTAVKSRASAYQARRRVVRWAAGIAAVAVAAVAAVGLLPRARVSTGPSPTVAEEGSSPASESGGSASTVATAATPAHRTKRSEDTVKAEQKAARTPLTPAQTQMLKRAARLRAEGGRFVRQREYAKARVPLRRAIVLMDDILRDTADGEAATAALYEKYRCLALLGDYLGREACFESYLRIIRRRDGKEGAARALVEDAHRLIRERNTECAGRRLHHALRLCPKGRVAAAAHVVLGLAAERERLLDLAYAEYRAALDLKPPVPLAVKLHRAMIGIKTRQGRFDAATRDAEALCALPSGDIPTEDRIVHQWLLARLYARKGDGVRAASLLGDIAARRDSPLARLAQLELQRLADKAAGVEALE